MLILLSLLGCKQNAPLPYVGECAEYPEDVYDFGEIGVGTCLTGPVSIDWVASGDSWHLVVANSNPFLDFTGGSLLSLDFSALPLDGSTTLTHEIASDALPMPSFPGDVGLVPDRDLLLVTNRFTEGARTRVGEDALYFASIEDGDLEFRGLAEGGQDHLELGSDPQPIAYDPVSGQAFVLNLTDHTISVVDPLSDPIAVVDAVGEATISIALAADSDRSGSMLEVALLDVFDAEILFDEDWRMSYAEGTFRLWVPTADGIYRLTSQGDGLWDRSAINVELVGADAGLGELADPQFWASSQGSRLLFTETGTGDIGYAASGDFLGDWVIESASVIVGQDGAWDEQLGGVDQLYFDGDSWLFYDGVDASGQGGIGAVTSTDDLTFERFSDDPLIAAGNGAHDAERAADPAIVVDGQGRMYRMYYGAWDGTTWTVGHAWSEDLLTWTVEDAPVFSADDGGHAAAPVVEYVSGEFRMWTTRGEPGAWTVGLATSTDGWSWTDQGVVATLEGAPGDDTAANPPGVGLQAQVSETWSLAGDIRGSTGLIFQSGDVIVAPDFGFEFQLSTGAVFAPSRAPEAGVNGVSPSSWLPDEGLVYLSYLDKRGVPSIGVAEYDGAEVSFVGDTILEGEEGAFDEGGVFSPVVYAYDGGYHMLYAGTSDGRTSIGLATSSDGLTWASDHEAVFEPAEGWDSVLVEPGSVVVDGSSIELWYTGDDGERTRIGLATSEDGETWTRAASDGDDWAFGEGSPGEFDDSSVRDPAVIRDGDTEHLWYAGLDGDSYRLGYAFREDGGEWQRILDPETEEALPVLSGRGGSFDADGAARPVVVQTDAGFDILYSGTDGPIPRGGAAFAPEPFQLYRAPRFPTAGDYISFSTRRGDDGDNLTAIPLEVNVEGFVVGGIGGSSLLVDNERGFLYVSLKLNNYIYVIDIRDDSDTYWEDSNYLDVEALLVADATAGADGFRGMHIPEGSPYLYAVNDEPESVMIFDLSMVEDDDLAQLARDPVVGYLPAPRGAERDEGAPTGDSVGPTQVTSLGDVMYVANFNDNSVGVYDLRLGVYGSLFAELDMLGENPHALSISPDGRYMAVANYIGDLSAGRISSSLTIIDVDPTSPTYLETLAWIANE